MMLSKFISKRNSRAATTAIGVPIQSIPTCCTPKVALLLQPRPVQSFMTKGRPAYPAALRASYLTLNRDSLMPEAKNGLICRVGTFRKAIGAFQCR